MSDVKENAQSEMLKIRTLVERDDDEEEAEWALCDDSELDARIEEYREAIRYLTSELSFPPFPAVHEEIRAEEPPWVTTEIPPNCIPILADVRSYDWRQLYRTRQFDVIMMDPPWQLATSNPTRGVALGYGQLTNKDILNIPIEKLQSKGLLFLWVINASFDFAMTLFERWGYTVVDEIVWVKLTVNRRLAKSHGYYLQHAKEVCLVGMKGGGAGQPSMRPVSDVILSERRGQSQKPDEIYSLIEQLVPNGRYLEIFARPNNLRNHWVSLGNEVLSTSTADTRTTSFQ